MIETSSGWLAQEKDIQRLYWIVKPQEVGNQGSSGMLVNFLAYFYSKHLAVKNLLFLYNRSPNSGRENLTNPVQFIQVHYSIDMWLLNVCTLLGRERNSQRRNDFELWRWGSHPRDDGVVSGEKKHHSSLLQIYIPSGLKIAAWKKEYRSAKEHIPATFKDFPKAIIYFCLHITLWYLQGGLVNEGFIPGCSLPS